MFAQNTHPIVSCKNEWWRSEASWQRTACLPGLQQAEQGGVSGPDFSPSFRRKFYPCSNTPQGSPASTTRSTKAGKHGCVAPAAKEAQTGCKHCIARGDSGGSCGGSSTCCCRSCAKSGTGAWLSAASTLKQFLAAHALKQSSAATRIVHSSSLDLYVDSVSASCRCHFPEDNALQDLSPARSERYFQRASEAALDCDPFEMLRWFSIAPQLATGCVVKEMLEHPLAGSMVEGAAEVRGSFAPRTIQQSHAKSTCSAVRDIS